MGQEDAGSLRAYAASLSGGAISGCVSPFAEVTLDDEHRKHARSVIPTITSN